MAMVVAGVGRLVKDCEVKEVSEKANIVKFSIAVDRDKENADFFDCFMFVSKNSKLSEYLKKGKAVFISGSLQQERWESKDGQKRSRVVIKVDNLQLLGGNGKSGSKNEAPTVEEVEEDFEF
ncbi:single-strand binding protein (plasmid) [Thermovibrio ammonificans HB-1]|uniref:Single-stranded DNA-binding protein n=1 Tax=Thermovibrio ammonificans (strain DSM 15698 / JCM 12110 / HB-1) TaxID=648996 RepID=E8T6W4_THEA1|nr:single-stranded DNA-binding protein [Thermovibrio ammonificans]ADU97787.1 single-strand binding protein [Thermovibrio ammonificans HB-1]